LLLRTEWHKPVSAWGVPMQYCMGTPRFFLQGLKYRNLTTIRTSGDRFEPGKWSDFLYVSRLANEVGVWPWCDVFKSGETANMILSVLSAGPVGTGDALGRENKENIMKAARPDGIIVKPDQPLLPTDQTTIDGANMSRAPFVATTFTDHNGLRTRYLFAFPRAQGEKVVNIRLRDLGVSEHSYVLNLMDGNGQFCGPDDRIRETIGKQGFLYLMIAPSMGQGFAFLGDAAKFVPTGKQRIVSIAKDPKGLRIRVSFAPQENEISLQCASQSQFALTGPGLTPPQRSGPTRFSFTVKPRRGARFGEFVLVLPR